MALIFVLDDDISWLAVLERVLPTIGHEVCTFSSSEALEQALRTRVPDVVMLDYTIPGTNGCAVARSLRERLRERCPRLILMSGRGQSIAPWSTGLFELHLRKPVRLRELKGAIEHALASCG